MAPVNPPGSNKRSPTKAKKIEPLPSATISGFYSIEDKLAENLTNQDIESEMQANVDFIRSQILNCIKSPEQWKKQEARDAVLVRAIKLRRLNRLSNFRNKLLRDRLAVARHNVEGQFLSLQNLQSEISHLKKTTEGCLEFQASDGDIELVPLEEFYANAPDSISRPDVTKLDAHQLHMARLNYELLERKNILGTLQELEGRKNVLLSDIRGKEQRLAQIKPKIFSLKEAARPLLDILGLKSVKSSSFEVQNLAKYLPMELNLIYVNAGVFQEIFGERSLDVSLEGDVQLAAKFEELQKARLEEDEDGDELEEGDDKKDEDEGGEKDEEQKRKHGKHKTSTTEQSVSNKVQRKKEQLLTVHPISVQIDLNDPKAYLKLFYFTELKTVGIKCILEEESKIAESSLYQQFFDSENLLDNLFDNDSGEICPNLRGDTLMNIYGMAMADITATGKQYNFVQSLCGLRFTESVSSAVTDDRPTSMQQFRLLVDVIAKIRRRINTRMALLAYLKELAQSKCSMSIPASLKQAHIPPKIISQLASFKVLKAEEFAAFSGFSFWQRALVDELSVSRALGSGLQCQGIVERTPFSLVANIHIPVSYPDSTSIFLLTVRSQEYQSTEYSRAINALEGFLNVSAKDLLSEDNFEELLPFQMALLVSRLDVVLEVISKRVGTNEFALEHNFSAFANGKCQNLPLSYNPLAASFDFEKI